MSLFDETPKSKNDRLSNFIRLIEGIPVTFQLLEEDSTVKFQHWITSSDNKKVAVQCYGFAGCPICENNQKLGSREHPNFNPIQRRYLVNVLDLTLCKRDADDGIYFATRNESGKMIFPETDSNGKSLADTKIEPLREVRILEGSPTLFKNLKVTNDTVTDETGTVVGITNFPVQVVRTGTGRETTFSVIPFVGSKIAVNPADYADKLFDLKVNKGFEREEIRALVEGTSLKDVLSAKRALAQSGQESGGDTRPEIDY